MYIDVKLENSSQQPPAWWWWCLATTRAPGGGATISHFIPPIIRHSAAETAEKPGKFGQFGQVLIFIFILHMLIYPQYTQAPDAALFCLNYFSYRRKYLQSTYRTASRKRLFHITQRAESWEVAGYILRRHPRPGPFVGSLLLSEN